MCTKGIVGKCQSTSSLRAGSLVWMGSRNRELARRMGRGIEPARELLIFEFPAFADERSDPIGLN